MYYIGIDPSLQRTGFAVINEQGYIVETGSIATKPVDFEDPYPDLKRYDHIIGVLLSVVNSYQPCSIMIESMPFGSGGYGVQDRSKLIGILEYNLYIKYEKEAGILELNKIAPKSLKKRVAGSGNADKADMKAALDTLFKHDLRLNNDEYDALGLAMCAGGWL